MEIPRPSRTCSISQREFLPGEPFFSILTEENEQFLRNDIAAEHWSGPPAKFFGWWKSPAKHVTDNSSHRQISGESLLNLFEQLATQQDNDDTRYVLTLLLLRRKLLRYEREVEDERGNKIIEVYSLNTNLMYQIPVAMPNHDRLESIQRQLTELM